MERSSNNAPPVPGVVDVISACSAHLIVGTICPLVAGALFAFLILLVWSGFSSQADFRLLQAWLVGRPFFFQLIPAGLLGWFVAHRLRAQAFAVWAWTVPALALLARLTLWRPGSVLLEGGAWKHFFGACPRPYCSDQFTATLPFYSVLVYCAAAFIRSRCWQSTLSVETRGKQGKGGERGHP